MHNNYYFLQHLCTELEHQLKGWTLEACFSQNKDELILGFCKEEKDFYIKATLQSDFSCLSFPEDFQRAKKNSIDLMKPIIGTQVMKITVFENDRSFALHLSQNQTLVFKMHGNRANILLFRQEHLDEVFKNQLHKDKELKLNSLEKPLLQNYTSFVESDENLQALFPTFGKYMIQELSDQNFSTLNSTEKWDLIGSLLEQVKKPEFYLGNYQDQLIISLIPLKEMSDVITFHSAIETLNAFYKKYYQSTFFENRKKELLQSLTKEKEKLEKNLEKLSHRLDEISTQNRWDEIANIIMANLHQIPESSSQIELFDFYHNRNIKIALKKQLSPQENAAVYYKKAKNIHKEFAHTEDKIKQNQAKLEEVKVKTKTLEDAENHHELKKIYSTEESQKKEKNILESLFRYFTYMDYVILVGKSAANNDLLIRNYAASNDLWLHAKDVAGSHVIIKTKPGHKTPRPVIEKAAQLAAYYSKRKHENHCPVIITERKNIKKSKKMLPGQVSVSHETVMMTSPSDFGY